MCSKITSLFHCKRKRKHSRNMKNEKEKCLFPMVSHFISESFICITSPSGLIKGTANYTHHPFFRLQRSTTFLLALHESAWAGDVCPGNQTLPHVCPPLQGFSAQREALLIPNQWQRKEKQQDPFHPTVLLSLPEPLKMVRKESTVFSSLCIFKL